LDIHASSRHFGQILVQVPGRSNEVRFIPGDPSASTGPQDDSLLNPQYFSAACQRSIAAAPIRS
jgi:hypothetical protein